MKKKKSKQITLNKRILILCEDEKSSLFYFKGFKNDEELKRKLSAVSIEVYHHKDYSPCGLVSEAKTKMAKAKKDQNPYDSVWIVFDKDGHVNIPKAFSDAKDAGVKVVLSSRCFEYWVLLHFENTTREFSKCDDIISYIKRKYFPEYDKSKNSFELLKDKMDIAIERAKGLIKSLKSDLDSGKKVYELDVYTNVHELVETIINS